METPSNDLETSFSFMENIDWDKLNDAYFGGVGINETGEFSGNTIDMKDITVIVDDFLTETSTNNSIDPATALRMDLVGLPPTKKCFLSNDEILTFKATVQGSGTIITKELELTKFINYINERGVTSDIKSIENKILGVLHPRQDKGGWVAARYFNLQGHSLTPECSYKRYPRIQHKYVACL